MFIVTGIKAGFAALFVWVGCCHHERYQIHLGCSHIWMREFLDETITITISLWRKGSLAYVCVCVCVCVCDFRKLGFYSMFYIYIYIYIFNVNSTLTTVHTSFAYSTLFILVY